MSYLIKQIAPIVNDAVADALGKNADITTLDSTDFVSLGKTLASYEAYEGFFKALANRIVKTVYFVRTYESKKRSVLRDEHVFGAFIQKVYYDIPDAVDNPTWSIPDGDGTYGQASPYDVENSVNVRTLLYGGQGTFSIEIIRPLKQIKTAFTSASAMASFIDGIYITVENAMKLDEERLCATAVNTAIASALHGGCYRNLLAEYNSKHSSDTLTVDEAMESASFLKYASKEINRTIKNMGKFSTVFNKNGYGTFTDKEHIVVEMLSEFSSASDMYLQADTFHNELVKLPNFEEVPFWQTSGNSAEFPFDMASSISIENDDLADDDDESTEVTQSGIICFVHDIENVACHFGDRRSWELVNQRSEVVIHGEKAEKGYAVDLNANAVVFYIAEAGTVTATLNDDTHCTATLSTQEAVRGKEIVLTLDLSDGYEATVEVDDVEIEAGEDGKYRYTPNSEADVDFDVTVSATV